MDLTRLIPSSIRQLFSYLFCWKSNKIKILSGQISIKLHDADKIHEFAVSILKPRESFFAFFFSRFRIYKEIKITGVNNLSLYAKINDLAKVLNKTRKEVLKLTPFQLGDFIKKKDLENQEKILFQKTSRLAQTLFKCHFCTKKELTDLSKLRPLVNIVSCKTIENFFLIFQTQQERKIFFQTLLSIGEQLELHRNKQSYYVYKEGEDILPIIIMDGQVYFKDGLKKFGSGTFKTVSSCTRLNDAELFAWATITEENIPLAELGKVRNEGAIADARKEQETLQNLRKAQARNVVPPYEGTILHTDFEHKKETLHMIQKAFRGSELVDADPSQILDAALDISTGLVDIHANNKVHCDVKPDNLLSDGKKKWFVHDFGTVLKVGDNPEGGSPAYLPPEAFILNTIIKEWKEGYKIDPSLDSFGLGVTLFEMITGNAKAGPDISFCQLESQEKIDDVISNVINNIDKESEVRLAQINELKKSVETYQRLLENIKKSKILRKEKKEIKKIEKTMEGIKTDIGLTEDHKEAKINELKNKIDEFKNYKELKELGEQIKKMTEEKRAIKASGDLDSYKKIKAELEILSKQHKDICYELRLTREGSRIRAAKFKLGLHTTVQRIAKLETMKELPPEKKELKKQLLSSICKPLLAFDPKSRMSCGDVVKQLLAIKVIGLEKQEAL